MSIFGQASFQELQDNITKLETATYASPLDIAKFFASDDEILKKLVKKYHPEMTVEDIDDFCEEAKSQKDKYKKKEDDEESKLEEEEEERLKKEEKEAKSQERKKRIEEEKQKRREEIQKRKEEREERRKQRKEIYAQRLAEYKEKVKEIKKELREAVHKLMVNFLDLVRKLAQGLIDSVAGLVSVAIKIAAPPWNLADAVITLLGILRFYFDLTKTLKLVAPILGPLKWLPIVIKEEELAPVSRILNPVILAILALFGPIAELNKFINSVLEKLLLLIKPDEQKKNFRRLSRRLRKLGDCNNDVDEDDEDEVRAIKDQYIIGDCGKIGLSLKKSGNSCKCVIGIKGADGKDLDVSKLEEQLKILNKPDDDLLQGYTTPSTIVTFDILFPDGTTQIGLTEQQVEQYRSQYNLLFNS